MTTNADADRLHFAYLLQPAALVIEQEPAFASAQEWLKLMGERVAEECLALATEYRIHRRLDFSNLELSVVGQPSATSEGLEILLLNRLPELRDVRPDCRLIVSTDRWVAGFFIVANEHED